MTVQLHVNNSIIISSKAIFSCINTKHGFRLHHRWLSAVRSSPLSLSKSSLAFAFPSLLSLCFYSCPLKFSLTNPAFVFARHHLSLSVLLSAAGMLLHFYTQLNVYLQLLSTIIPPIWRKKSLIWVLIISQLLYSSHAKTLKLLINGFFFCADDLEGIA